MGMIKAELLDYMGNDDSVANAARVSFAKTAENYTADKNASLIKFLASEGHDLPFAHTAVTFRCSAPLPTRTHCFKSKIGFVENEESRRYISSTPELFIPKEFRSAAKDKKQGSGAVHCDSDWWLAEYEFSCNRMIGLYESMISGGICPEQARYILPQGVMVNWIWTGSMLAYSRFCNLRMKPDTQQETRELAGLIDKEMSRLYPISWEALKKW